MAFFERFVYKKTGHQVQEIGTECLQTLDPSTLIATRPFLNSERFERKKRRRGAANIPHVVSIADSNYLVDGHHKTRRAIEAGATEIECVVLFTNNEKIERELKKANHGLIVNLQITQSQNI